MISEERKDYLYDYYCSEMNESETHDWRNDLTAEEAALVNEWDEAYIKTCNIIKEDIYKQQQKNAEHLK